LDEVVARLKTGQGWSTPMVAFEEQERVDERLAKAIDRAGSGDGARVLTRLVSPACQAVG